MIADDGPNLLIMLAFVAVVACVATLLACAAALVRRWWRNR